MSRTTTSGGNQQGPSPWIAEQESNGPPAASNVLSRGFATADEVAGCLQSMVGRQQLRAHYQELIGSERDPAAGFHGLGVVEQTERKLESAIEYFRAALGLRESAESHECIALVFAARGDDYNASIHLERACLLAPTAVRFVTLAACYWRSLQPNHAERALSQAVALDAQVAGGFELQSEILLAQGAWAEAVSLHRRHLEADPARHERWWRYADALRRAGSFAASVSAATTAIRVWQERAIVTRDLKAAALDPPAGRRVLRRARERLERAGVQFFVCAGTALGLIREGELLEHDKDIDLGVFAGETTQETVIRALCEDGEFVISPLLFQGAAARKWRIACLHAQEKAALDVFFFHPDGDEHYLCGLYNVNQSIVSRVRRFGIRSIRWWNRDWPVPETSYLEDLYGVEWQTPDLHFDTVVASRSRIPESLEVRRAYGYAQIYLALAQGRWARARSLCLEVNKMMAADPFLASLGQQLAKREVST